MLKRDYGRVVSPYKVKTPKFQIELFKSQNRSFSAAYIEKTLSEYTQCLFFCY